MKLADNVFPSNIAKILAHEVGLIPDPHAVNWSMDDGMRELIEFQQMSLVASFEDCLTVYFGTQLNQDQIKNLNIIYQVTHKLLPGCLLKAALEKIATESEKSKPDMKTISGAFHTAINQLTKRRAA